MRTRKGPERRAKDGAILVSFNHICLLHGLLDRPNGTARSLRDWYRAAHPYRKRYGRCYGVADLSECVASMHSSWVALRWVENRIEVRIRPGGRRILERRVRVRVRGLGTYEGLPSELPKNGTN